MGLFFGRKRRSKHRSITSSIPFARFLGPIVTGAGILVVLFMALTGRVDLSAFDLLQGTAATADGGPAAKLQPINLQSLGPKSNQTIKIATFNIQSFDAKKSSDAKVMAILAKVVSQFDVVAIQEVGGGDPPPVQALIDLLRASGARFSARVSEPIGRATQTESYAFVWDESRIHFVPQSAYVVQDTSDRMHREPMVASFETRVGTADGRRPFRFTLINANTSQPDGASSAIEDEMNVLDDVFVRVRQYDYESNGEEDCIMLGDLNVNTAGLQELGRVPNVQSVAGDIVTNILRNATDDHILMDRTMTREFTGRFGIVDFQRDFGLSKEQALQISDHQPLWAEFNAYEMPIFDPVAAHSRTMR